MAAYELTKTILKDSANLKAYYRFESGALTTDSSASGYTLTNNGTVADGTGVYGGAADQGASNSTKYFTRATAVIAPISDYTISLWVKLNTEIGSGTYEFLHIENNTEKHVIYMTYEYNAGTRRIVFQQARWVIAGYTATYNVTLGTSSWHHLVMRKSGTSIHAYVDGAYVATSLAVSNVVGDTTVNNQLLIGAGTTEGTGTVKNYSSALIDDVAIFQQALSADQIKELYEGRYIGEWMPATDTRAIYHLSSETDASGNNYHLTNNGTTTFTQGKFVNCADLGTANSTKYFKVSSNLGISGAGSMSFIFWVKNRTEIAANAYRMFEFVTQSGSNRYLSLSYQYNGGTRRFAFDTSGTSGTYNITMGTSSWYCVALVRDVSGGNTYLYINGNPVVSAANGTSVYARDYLTIGADETGQAVTCASSYFDEFTAFSRALTAAEIRHWYAWSVGKYL